MAVAKSMKPEGEGGGVATELDVVRTAAAAAAVGFAGTLVDGFSESCIKAVMVEGADCSCCGGGGGGVPDAVSERAGEIVRGADEVVDARGEVMGEGVAEVEAEPGGATGSGSKLIRSGACEGEAVAVAAAGVAFLSAGGALKSLSNSAGSMEIDLASSISMKVIAE